MVKPLISFCVVVAFIAAPVNARMPSFLEQNFEDTNVFIAGDPLALGIGDGNDVDGLFQGLNSNSTVVGGDFYPKTDPANSSFTNGAQCIRIKREVVSYAGNSINVGFTGGKRSNHSLKGAFYAEFSIYIKDANSQFSLSLVDSNGMNSNKVAVAFFNKKLNTSEGGIWKPKTGGIVQGEWFKIAFSGNINTGKYSTYINFGKKVNMGWTQLSANDPFDTASLKNIAGFVFAPWLVNYEFCLDDVRFFGDYENAVSCGEALDMGSSYTGDINNDCKVSLQDVALLAADWLTCVDPQNAQCEQTVN